MLARLLTQRDFGLVAMVSAFSMWFMNFGINGFSEYIIQKKHISKEEVNSVFWIHILIAGLLALGFTCFGIYLVDFYSEPALWGISAALSTSFVLTALFTSHLALLKREMQFASIAIVGLVAVILSIVFALIAAVAEMTYWAIVIRQLTIPIVFVVGGWIFCPWRPDYSVHPSLALPGLKYAIQVYCNFSLGYMTRNVGKVLLGKFYGTEALGNYDRAYYLSMMPLAQFLKPLNNVTLATLCRLVNEKERFISYYTKAVGIVSFLGTAAALILTLTAHDLIKILLGPEWNDAGQVLMAFGPGVAARLIYSTNSWLHLSLGTPNRWLQWNLIASIITITAIVIAAPHGATAMAIAYSTAAYVLVVPGLWYAGRGIVSIKAIINSVWTYFASALLVCIIWLYSSSYWFSLKGLLANNSPLNRLIMTFFIAGFLYIALVILLQRSLRSIREIISLVELFTSRKQP